MQSFYDFRNRFTSNEIKFQNEKINQMSHNYSINIISDKNDISLNEEINQNIKESEIIIINQIEKDDQKAESKFFFIIFKKTIIIIQQIFITFLENLFQSNHNLTILFLSKTKEIFDNLISLKYTNFELTGHLKDYCSSIKRYFNIFRGENEIAKKIIRILKDSIPIIMIIHSYNKLNQRRLLKINSDENDRFIINNINENDIIELRTIGSGYSALGILCYYIEKEELVLKKKIILTDDLEVEKINKREIENYKKMSHHPFLPKFYGTIKERNDIVIEFIDGKSLQEIKQINLTENDRITIIFELLIFFELIHRKHLIYRDLKPNNVMIDRNKTAVLIDFDRMLNSDELERIDDFTVDFMSDFMAPEVNEGKVSYECDIYSIGYMMYYIMKEKIPSNQSDDEDFGKYSLIKELFIKCTKEKPNERPTINELIVEFYVNYQSQIQIENIDKIIDIESIINNQKEKEKNEGKKLNEIAEKYIRGINCKQDIFKAIEYYKLSAEKNYPEALINLAHVYIEIFNDTKEGIKYLEIASNQNYDEAEYELGIIYLTGDGVERDINKSIYYLIRASKKNHVKSLRQLGKIYLNRKYVEYNINKALYYFDFASKLGDSYSQVFIAILYHEGSFVKRDLNKAFYYFDLAAKQNDVEALFNLGIMYLNGEGVNEDINKSIDYFQRAADQNHYKAQHDLGYIYITGKYVKKDINKAIKYFTLAADQNFVESQYQLGVIYCENHKNIYDINKGVNYLTLAANQNHASAQFSLGCFYYEGKLALQNIDKAIYYFTLAANNNHIQAQLNLGDIFIKGKFVYRNINKSIYYFTLAANQNNVEARFALGIIYYDNQYIKQDMNKSIKFFSLAAEQNYLKALISLADIYHVGKYISQDSKKAIHYYTLAAKQNDPSSLAHLGEIYLKGNEITRDINRAVYYYTRAADLNYANAQCNLGILYYNGEYNEIPRDVDKAIHYFSLAANNHHPYAYYALGYIFLEEDSKYYDLEKAFIYLLKASNLNVSYAQYWLGWAYFLKQPENIDINKIIQCFSTAANNDNSQAQLVLWSIFYEGLLIPKNIDKGIEYLKLASKNDSYEAKFILGCIYYENLDFEKAVSYFKEASLIYENYSRNNLGIIYKNGNGEKFPKNTASAIYFFNKAINKNDTLSMYNLAHIYFYEEANEENINKSIELLIKSYEKGFTQSIDLLCLVLIKKFGFDLENIKKEICDNLNKSVEMNTLICDSIKTHQLNNQLFYEEQFQLYKDIDFIYDYYFNVIQSTAFLNKKLNLNSKENQMINDINDDFYDGFGL